MTIVLQYRNPGDELRGIITVAQIDAAEATRVFVQSTPAVTVGPDMVDPDFYIAKCECFKLAGDGPTAVKAIEELNWTLRCYLEELLQMGDLVPELQRLGWKPVRNATIRDERRLLLELRSGAGATLSDTLLQVSAQMLPSLEGS